MAILAGSVPWGDVSGWVSGIGSLLAVVVALSFAVIQYRESRAERLRAIYAWVENHGSNEWSLVVNNLTQHPIYQWSVRLEWPTRQGQPTFDSVGAVQVGLMPPGLNRYAWSPAGSVPEVDSGVTVSIQFVDASGRKYERVPRGGLRRIVGRGELHG